MARRKKVEVAKDYVDSEANAISVKPVNANPINPGQISVPLVSQLGATGLKEYNGYIDEDFLVNLRGWEAVKLYHEMSSNDAVIGAMLFACAMLIRRADWKVQPHDDDAGSDGDDAVDFVKGIMDDMGHSWGQFIEEVTSMLCYGYAPFEVVWKVRGGPDQADPRLRSKFSDRRFGVRKIELRSQDSVQRWLFDHQTGDFEGLVQQTETGKYAVIPADRLLVFRTVSKKDNPEGISILRNSYVSYIRKKAVEDAEGRAALRASGLVVLRIPGILMSAEADSEQKAAYAAYKQMATNMAKDRQGALILPSDTDGTGKMQYDVSYVVADGRRAIDFTQIIERHNKAMATSILADFVFLGQQAVGSFALSSDKTALFADALAAHLKGIADILNRHLLPQLWKINNFDPSLMPKLVPGDLESPNLQELGAYIAALAQSGAPLWPDDKLLAYLHEAANLPEPSPEALPTAGAAATAALRQASPPSNTNGPTPQTDVDGNPLPKPDTSMGVGGPGQGAAPRIAAPGKTSTGKA